MQKAPNSPSFAFLAIRHSILLNEQLIITAYSDITDLRNSQKKVFSFECCNYISERNFEIYFFLAIKITKFAMADPVFMAFFTDSYLEQMLSSLEEILCNSKTLDFVL